MNMHLLPTAVSPPSSSVPVFMVTCSRISQSAPIVRPCRAAAILDRLRRCTERGERINDSAIANGCMARQRRHD